jgi:hypothetical protein
VKYSSIRILHSAVGLFHCVAAGTQTRFVVPLISFQKIVQVGLGRAATSVHSGSRRRGGVSSAGVGGGFSDIGKEVTGETRVAD